MIVEQVDERDNNWEARNARYRIYLFGPMGEGESKGLSGVSTNTLEVWDADLLEVLAYAEQRAGIEYLWALALVADDDGQRGLLWLSGVDYNDGLEAKTERGRAVMEQRLSDARSRAAGA